MQPITAMKKKAILFNAEELVRSVEHVRDAVTGRRKLALRTTELPTLHLSLANDCGSHLADGAEAAEYRRGRIDPHLARCEKAVLDFSDVRTANSSFVNALVSGLVEQHGEAVLAKLVFKGCNPVLRVLVEGAIDLGLQKNESRVDA